MLAHKWNQSYSTTLWWLRCRLTFSLIRSAIQTLCGARESEGHAIHSPASVDLVITESGIALDSWFLLQIHLPFFVLMFALIMSLDCIFVIIDNVI